MKDPARFDRNRLRLDHWIARFFASSAWLTIVVLGLITFFLFQEGAGFFPQNGSELRVYRLAGLEYLDIMRGQLATHAALAGRLQTARLNLLKRRLAAGEPQESAEAALQPLADFADRWDAAAGPLRGLISDWSDVALELKEKAKLRDDALLARQFLEKEGKREEAAAVPVAEVDFVAELATVLSAFPDYQAAAKELQTELAGLLRQTETPATTSPGASAAASTTSAATFTTSSAASSAAPATLSELLSALPAKELAGFQKAAHAYLSGFPATERQLQEWRQSGQLAPVPWWRVITSFFFGTQWITNSFWQDWYGVLPLLAGSLLVALIAVAIAMPLGLCAAVYVSELSRPAEARFIKPALEFIAAIPSVVLGFFGIAVLGEGLRQLSQWGGLGWVPGFPIVERLNAFTAGCLLALMAVPTIFTLAEDAISSVPKSFKEASIALGATRLQTVFRVLVPGAASGMVSAVLLGFGRVIGETMVVLLCAGNRIAIPDFTRGLGAVFEPVHTMTGLIAQELGEVPHGVIQYRALFMVGLFLFFITLGLNWFVQRMARKKKQV